jgi:hypothetical protein
LTQAARHGGGTAPSGYVTTPHASAVSASVVLYGDNGQTLLRSTTSRVALHKVAPNGVACGPVCYSAHVRLTASGTIVDNPSQ